MAEYIERNKLTCQDCYHNRVCFGFGFVLDPLHGGVICVDFVNAADVVEVGNCGGCLYSHRKRPQKCSCCRRNPDMKDCYEED